MPWVKLQILIICKLKKFFFICNNSFRNTLFWNVMFFVTNAKKFNNFWWKFNVVYMEYPAFQVRERKDFNFFCKLLVPSLPGKNINNTIFSREITHKQYNSNTIRRENYWYHRARIVLVSTLYFKYLLRTIEQACV